MSSTTQALITPSVSSVSAHVKRSVALPSSGSQPSSQAPRAQAAMSTLSIEKKLLCAGTAACIADVITFPLDTAKVRLQVQGEGAGGAASGVRYSGIYGTLKTISTTEGPRAMYNGIVPGLQRQMCFASIRIGLYDTVKQTYTELFKGDPSKPNVGLRILAGITTGGAAVLCAQPTDVVKVRMQAAPAGAAKRYSGVMSAYRTIAIKEGVKGLWKGTSANVTRNAVVNASELVSYDLIKEALLKYTVLKDNIYCHFLSAFGAGFCTTVVASPVDVVKTRFMNSAPGAYSGVINCAVTMFKNEGPTAFYKGFMPSYVRLGSWNIFMFVCYEQLKRLASTPVPTYIGSSSIEINKSNKQLL